MRRWREDIGVLVARNTKCTYSLPGRTEKNNKFMA